MRVPVFWALLIGTVALSFYLTAQGKQLIRAGTPGAIVDLELAWTKTAAQSVIAKWANVLHVARRSIYVDFVFIVFYSLLLRMVCAAASQHLNGGWQRAGELLAWGMLVAGVLDVIENIGMLMMLNGNFAPVLIVSIAAAVKFLLLAAGVVYILAAHVAR
ncbi:MAG TPA: hypothetical protein VNI54_02185 [Thermoanaerobaculia bacterium]|nr:hypothetical protein [Thermoanaerobaculia bacterium]